MIEKKLLVQQYSTKGLSVHDIATCLGCSETKVTYWLQKHNIRKRTISEAIYLKNNPNGNPFEFRKPRTSEEWFLYGLGLGLFWGEGNKVDKHAVRLGNTDPALIRKFLSFLKSIYQVDEKKLTYGLQIFSDVSKREALDFWCKELSEPKEKFQKVIVTESKRTGTYRAKSKYGVLTIYFSNVKLRDSIVDAIHDLQSDKMPS